MLAIVSAGGGGSGTIRGETVQGRLSYTRFNAKYVIKFLNSVFVNLSCVFREIFS